MRNAISAITSTLDSGNDNRSLRLSSLTAVRRSSRNSFSFPTPREAADASEPAVGDCAVLVVDAEGDPVPDGDVNRDSGF